MTDRTTKFLLAVIALLLIVQLVRPTALAPVAAQAQTGMPASAAGQMLVENGRVYVLHNGQLSVYELEIPGQGVKNPPKLHEVSSINLQTP